MIPRCSPIQSNCIIMRVCVTKVKKVSITGIGEKLDHFSESLNQLELFQGEVEK